MTPDLFNSGARGARIIGTEADAPCWVSQSEAARRETAAGRRVTQSSISRLLDANPDVPVQRGANGKVRLVDYRALARVRLKSLPARDDLDGRAPSSTAPATSEEMGPSARQRAAQAALSELRLAQRKAALVSVEAVALALETAEPVFRQAMEDRRASLAERILQMGDVRTVELELRVSDRAMLQAIAAQLGRPAVASA